MFKLFSRKKSAAQAAAERARERQSQLPAGERDWASVRAPARPQDRLLSRQTLAWYEVLPKGIRPAELCQRYPRVANQIALYWDDAASAQHALDSLVLDTRPGRKGFPPFVATELTRLREYRAELDQAAAQTEACPFPAAADR